MWTKAQMAKLSVEQQELVARFELSKLRQRQQLLEVVRGRNWFSRCVPILLIWTPWLVLQILELCKFFDSKQMTFVIYASNGLALFSGIIWMLYSLIDHRLNALVKLLDLDHKDPTDSNNSKDEKVG